MNTPATATLEHIYGEDAAKASARYQHLAEEFEKNFGAKDVTYYSAPGRTEIIGNHVDHNGGRILAASITMDTIAAAARTSDGKVTVVSEGYRPVVIDLDKAAQTPHCKGTLSLIAGILEGMKHFGFQVGGFQAYVTSEVIPSAGVSSSASFEMLICAILNHLYNDDKMDYAFYAKAGQFAENHFWDKASGLMDQMACAVGGTICLDFAEDVKYEQVEFSYDMLDSNLMIVNTGKGHADLSEEYSSIPNEMRLVAAELGVKNLSETTEEALLEKLPQIREKLHCDRAVIRALHYYEECARVDEAVKALKAGEKDRMLELIKEGGNSSWKWLQNGYVTGDKVEQSIPLALSLTEIFCRKIGAGVSRIHGGGFAGVIMAVIPKEHADEYIEYMAPYFGKENVYKMGIRATGAVTVE